MEKDSLSGREFVALVAALMAIEAIAIDIMLPALPDIGAAFQVADPNDRSLVLTAFLIGFGLPQLVFGPLSDRFGRRGPILAGLAVYIVCAFGSPAVESFATLLWVRFAQGVAAAVIRVGILSAVRDRYRGAAMSEVISVAMSIFLLVPLIMPGVGQLILLAGPWELIFVAMGVVAAAVAVGPCCACRRRSPGVTAGRSASAASPRALAWSSATELPFSTACRACSCSASSSR